MKAQMKMKMNSFVQLSVLYSFGIVTIFIMFLVSLDHWSFQIQLSVMFAPFALCVKWKIKRKTTDVRLRLRCTASAFEKQIFSS